MVPIGKYTALPKCLQPSVQSLLHSIAMHACIELRKQFTRDENGYSTARRIKAVLTK